MSILAFLIAIVVDAAVITVAVATFRRTYSKAARIAASLFAVVAIIGSTAVASLTTTTVQTRLVMAGMRKQEPTATILAADPQMRAKLEAAVRSGLSQEGSKVENVKAAVSEVLRPYMSYRLGHAPDRYTVASARATLEMLRRARTEGPPTCNAVLSGSLETLRRLSTPAQSAWLSDMLKADSLDTVRVADQPTFGAFIQKVALDKGWTIQDLASASSRQGRMACDYPIATIEAAINLPEDQAAAMLRRLGVGAQVVTAR